MRLLYPRGFDESILGRASLFVWCFFLSGPLILSCFVGLSLRAIFAFFCQQGCTDTGAPIMVPVGQETLGRIMNVIGEPVDERGPINSKAKVTNNAISRVQRDKLVVESVSC